MKYAAKFYTTENDVLTRFGFDPETSVIKNIVFNAETGDIEILIRSTNQNESTSETDGLNFNIRRKRI